MTKSKKYQNNPNPIHDGLHNLLTGKSWSHRKKSKRYGHHDSDSDDNIQPQSTSRQQLNPDRGAAYNSNNNDPSTGGDAENFGGMRSWNDILGRNGGGGGGGIGNAGGSHLKYPRRGGQFSTPGYNSLGNNARELNQRGQQLNQGYSISGQPGANKVGFASGQKQGGQGGQGWSISGQPENSNQGSSEQAQNQGGFKQS